MDSTTTPTEAQVKFRAGANREDLLSRRKPSSTTASAVARRDLARYYALLKQARPVFEHREARLIHEVLGRITFKKEHGVVSQLGMAFDQAPDHHYEKWRIEKASFVKRIRGFSYAEGLALVDAVEQIEGELSRNGTAVNDGICALLNSRS